MIAAADCGSPIEPCGALEGVADEIWDKGVEIGNRARFEFDARCSRVVVAINDGTRLTVGKIVPPLLLALFALLGYGYVRILSSPHR